MYSRNNFSSTATSPPNASFRSDVFSPGALSAKPTAPSLSSSSSSQLYSTSPTAERRPSEQRKPTDIRPASLSTGVSDPTGFGFDMRPAPAIVIRRLPRNFTSDALMSMLIFAGDLLDTELIRSPYAEDHAFSTAIARFRSQAGALEAQQKLNGKPNTTKDANMIVEVHGGGVAASLERRATVDVIATSRGSASRTQSASASSGGSGNSINLLQGRSRFGSTFQSNEKISPPLQTPSSAGSGGDFSIPDTTSRFHNLFSPQPHQTNGFDERNRNSGKSVINDSAVDDETGELLKDPVAYAKNGHQQQTRLPSNPQIPVARFGSLSLTTSNGSSNGNGGGSGSGNGNGNGNGDSSPPEGALTSPRSQGSIKSPMSPTNMTTMGPNGTYAMNFPRPQYPPVNPADQNPPCNTLYVGNLPIDTSEDELKTVFSKQRGYKRLCFRTKQNGPMCFVEFEDVSFATKALNELYGYPLHNSVKGGIRLSFSKNPLGVRSGQANGVPPNGAMNHQPLLPGAYTNNGHSASTPGAGFSAVSGPPPGLAMPPGLMNGVSPGNAPNSSSYRSPPATAASAIQMSAMAPLPNTTLPGLDNMFSNPFGVPTSFVDHMGGPRHLSGGLPPNITGQYSRDNRAGFSDFMLGR